jgi:geranylgeranyl reductase family protein
MSRSALITMSNTKEYDAVIIGGGPSGSSAGYLLAKKGGKVLIIDKKTFPRQKLCGGCLSGKTIQYLENIYGETAQSLIEKNIINFQAGQYKIYLNDKALIQGNLNQPFFFVNRCVYDKYLLDKAGDAGAEILEGDEVTEICQTQMSVKTASGKVIRSKHIIGADGTHSIVRKSLLNSDNTKKQWDKNLAIALELKIRYDKLVQLLNLNSIAEVKTKFTQPMLFLGVSEWGYGWIFPNKETAVIGICGLMRKNDKKIIQTFKKFLEAVGIRNIPDKISFSGYPMPYGNFIKNPAKGNILLVGDAGGFADPVLGEGIYYAHRTAELASYAIEKSLSEGGCAEKTYHNLIRKYVIPEMRHAKVFRNLVYFNLDHHMHKIISFIISVSKEKLINIVNGNTMFSPFKSEKDYYGKIKV